MGPFAHGPLAGFVQYMEEGPERAYAPTRGVVRFFPRRRLVLARVGSPLEGDDAGEASTEENALSLV